MPESLELPRAAIVVRFALGLFGAIGCGMLFFGRTLADPSAPEFQCLTVGALAAGLFALLRVGTVQQAALLVAAYALLRIGFAASQGWMRTIADLFVGGGVLLVGVIFEWLRRSRFVFGKFLLTGPLVAGLFLSAAPLAGFSTVRAESTPAWLVTQALVGLVIGNGVGLGIELFDVVARLVGATHVAPAVPAADPTNGRSNERSGAGSRLP